MLLRSLRSWGPVKFYKDKKRVMGVTTVLLRSLRSCGPVIFYKDKKRVLGVTIVLLRSLRSCGPVIFYKHKKHIGCYYSATAVLAVLWSCEILQRQKSVMGVTTVLLWSLRSCGPVVFYKDKKADCLLLQCYCVLVLLRSCCPVITRHLTCMKPLLSGPLCRCGPVFMCSKRNLCSTF